MERNHHNDITELDSGSGEEDNYYVIQLEESLNPSIASDDLPFKIPSEYCVIPKTWLFDWQQVDDEAFHMVSLKLH